MNTGRLLAKLAPPAQSFSVGLSCGATGRTPMASELAAAIASVQPRGAQLIAWVKYADDDNAQPALLRELLIEAARWPQSARPAKRQQLRIIINAAFDEWLSPKMCGDCGGSGSRFRRGEDGAKTPQDCLSCGGTGRVPRPDTARAAACGIHKDSWHDRMGGDRAYVYERVIVTLRRWDRALLATVDEAMRDA